MRVYNHGDVVDNLTSCIILQLTAAFCNFLGTSQIMKNYKMGNGVSQGGWNSSFGNLRRLHDEAYMKIEEAITLEEQERPNDAVEKYKDGILTIDRALDIVITCPENPDSTWTQACSMVQKMKKTRAEVLMRITSITSHPEYVHQEPPPSYEDAMSTSSDSSGPRTYVELAEALDNLQINTPQGIAQIIYSHGGVKLYFIDPNGTVLSTSEALTLNIALIDCEEEGKPPTAFLQVGTWIYPLIPGVSPCYRTDYGAFILPDLHSDIPGSSVGIILPDDADGAVLEIFENILRGVVIQDAKPELRVARTRRYTQDPGISGSVSRGIISGALYISKGLIFGAKKAGDLINYSTPRIIDSIQPAPAATPVPPKLQSGLKIAENATNKAAVVTGFVAEKVGVATSKLGHYLAPHIQKQGTKLLTNFNMTEEEASDKMKGVLTVAAGAVEGFSTVYQGLETSASILGDNLKQNSVKIVQHKYGAPAGEAANETLSTVGNLMAIRQNAKLFTPKGLAKSTVKQTGKAVVFTATSLPSNDLNQPGTSNQEKPYLYPDLEQLGSFNTENTLEKKKE